MSREYGVLRMRGVVNGHKQREVLVGDGERKARVL